MRCSHNISTIVLIHSSERQLLVGLHQRDHAVQRAVASAPLVVLKVVIDRALRIKHVRNQVHQHRNLLAGAVGARRLCEDFQLAHHIPRISVTLTTNCEELVHLPIEFFLGELHLHISSDRLTHRGGLILLLLVGSRLLLAHHFLFLLVIRSGGGFLQPARATFQLLAAVIFTLRRATGIIVRASAEQRVFIRVLCSRLGGLSLWLSSSRSGLGLGFVRLRRSVGVAIRSRIIAVAVRVTARVTAALTVALLDLLILIGVGTAIGYVSLVVLVVLAHLKLHLIQSTRNDWFHLFDALLILQGKLNMILHFSKHLDIKRRNATLQDKHLRLFNQFVNVGKLILNQRPIRVLAGVSDARNSLLHGIPLSILCGLHNSHFIFRVTVGFIVSSSKFFLGLLLHGRNITQGVTVTALFVLTGTGGCPKSRHL
mmetsp:Transcript_109148/g.213858  ORF Transcript_109148/g.213858 Transcript_109148/m.213858 type:complete len:427 (-) Transcript_109148:9-1289(-)